MDNELQMKMFEILQQLSETYEDNNSTNSKQLRAQQRRQRKKIRNVCDSLLFEQPFFELPRRHTYGVSRYIIARCRTCGAFMRGNKMLSVFENHMKVAHPDIHELYINWRDERTQNLKRLSSETSHVEEDVMFINDVKNEVISICEETPSIMSDATVDESTSQLIRNLLDQKLTPLLNTDSVTNFNNALNKLSQEVGELREQLKHSERERRVLEQEIQCLEREVQRNCIIIRGISFNENVTTPHEVIYNLFHNALGITDIVPIKIEVLSNSRHNSGTRQIAVTLDNKASAQHVLSQGYKLRYTGIYMEPIVTQNALKRKTKMLSLRREILRRNPNIRVRVSATQLFVGGYIFEWNILNYLTMINQHLSTKTAIECLNEATGLNMKMFVEELENEKNED